MNKTFKINRFLLCWSPKTFTTTKLLWLSIAVYMIVFLLTFHIFGHGFANVQKFDSLPSKVHLSGEQIQPNVSKIVLTQQTLVARTVKPVSVNSTNRSTNDSCQSWCQLVRKENSSARPFNLTAVLLLRIYVKDLAQLTTRELRQWLYYLQYAGFEHVYIYDAFVIKNESQAQALKSLIDQGFVTYVDWSHKASPYSIHGTQHSAYQDCINRFGRESIWQAAIDIDEYPFSPTDQQPKFAARAIARFSQKVPTASELTMQNYLFLGKPLDDTKHPLLIDRIWRRTHRPANLLVKPIYKPSHVARATVHHNSLKRGRSVNFPVDQLRMNHYWGARLQNWGEDTPEIIAKTEPDNSMESIVKTLQNCIGDCLPSVDFAYHKQWN